MFTTCPCCGAALDLTLTASRPDPVPGRSDGAVLTLVGAGHGTVREVAEQVAGRHPTPAEVERTRRQLARLVLAGRLQVDNKPTGGGRPLAVYRVTTTRPATG